jgi:ATP-dependent Clp protease ATP-binding subunit ClpA
MDRSKGLPARVPQPLDDVIVFRHLTTDDLKLVIDLELAKVRKRLQRAIAA